MPARKFKANTVFILGAGASFAASQGSRSETPLDQDFCRRLTEFSAKTSKNKWTIDLIQNLKANWKDFKALEDCGLEEAIIKHIGHLEFNQHIRRKINDNTLPNDCTPKFLRDMAHIISFFLSRAREGHSRFYKEIYKMVKSNPDNRIITFNYDTLLDRYFFRDNTPAQQLYFDNIVGEPALDAGKPTFPNPLMLKLHGSINWICKKSSFQLIIDGTRADKLQYIDNITYSPRKVNYKPTGQYAPCIIPPIPSKPITRISIFNYLWRQSELYIGEANELVICGYSLPPTDNLAYSLFCGTNFKRLSKVTIIDPNPDIYLKWRRIINRQRPHSKWAYFPSGNDFLDEIRYESAARKKAG